MENKHSRLALVLMTLVLLVALALGSVAPGAVAQVMEAQPGVPGLLAEPYCGGGSGS